MRRKTPKIPKCNSKAELNHAKPAFLCNYIVICNFYKIPKYQVGLEPGLDPESEQKLKQWFC